MTLPPSFFDAMYAAAEDPWSMRARWYERRKYALTTAVLPRERYAEGLEVGCSVGELTARLADRCDRLTGWDASAAAVERATRRVAGAGSVRIEQATVPDHPLPQVDLLVLSEVLYYLDQPDLQRFLAQVPGAVRPGGTVLAVHWRHPVAEYPQTGDAVHEALRAALPWPRVAAHEEPDLLLDCWVVAGADDVRAASVAAAEQLW
ncbi:class I SAM-dependent methyltransferase [Modestobacter roseus]|uniref:Nodulation protein S (NodS) n=1 Tax=Modestobacter roseus TaxID=1181884 RepID=A0A562IMX2_9ACTN|nr:class I SAM-dependent methyltransferase [Modestobacter roseus]MQA32366.1 methyltransferase domain-containing protein [Modestobacter roseus]TWH72369.1 nodulation protein S (NodS) [Modestobacter roseus]